jgi:hypothetical protein
MALCAIEELTVAQQRFAQEHDAQVGYRAWDNDRRVFLYHEGAALTRRWLVDEYGQVVQTDVFGRTI